MVIITYIGKLEIAMGALLIVSTALMGLVVAVLILMLSAEAGPTAEINFPKVFQAAYGQFGQQQQQQPQAQVNNQTNQTIIPTNITQPQQQQTTSSDREMDILWNEIIDGCTELYRSDVNLVESGCDGDTMVNERNLDCEVYENQLLICDPNSVLGQKLQSYFNIIGYITTIPPPSPPQQLQPQPLNNETIIVNATRG